MSSLFLSSLKPLSSTVINALPQTLANAIREDERKAIALTVLGCAGASALTLKALRTISPSFDTKCYFWSRWIQSYVTYGFTSVTKPAFKKIFGGDYLAPCAGDTEINVQWLRGVLRSSLQIPIPENVVVTLDAEALTGGFIGNLRRITLTWPEGADERLPRTLVMKSVPRSRSRYFSSILHGSSREAYFYNEHAKKTGELSAMLPKVHYSNGSWITGEFVVLMEDLSKVAVSACVLLGNQCWGAGKIPKELEQDPLIVLETIFLETADFHAKFWRDFSLLKYHWFKTSEWVQGRNRAQWDLAMDCMRNKWNQILEALQNGKTKAVWSPVLIQAIDRALEHTSWTTFQREFNVNDPRTPFTLCHGDYHAGNVLWAGNNRPLSAIFVDWSDVGVFCPFTEIAQFMISNATIELRRKHERSLFESYHRRLIEKGVDAAVFPLEDCWDRYCAGGIEKWLQFLILIAAMNLQGAPIPEFGVTWFNGQVAAFVEDHGNRKSSRSPAFMTGFCVL